MQSPTSFRQKMWYSFGQFGNGVYNGLNNAIMGLFVSAFTGNPFIIGYLSNTRTMEGVIIQPIVGRWSDRSNGPMGRRRPFILFGIPLSVLFLILTPLAGHAGSHWALPLIIVSIVLFSITWNIAGDPYQALMIDITPEHERSIFNAILSVIALVGQVAILLYASVASIKKNNIPDPIFYLCAAFLLFTYAVVFFGVREPKEATIQARLEDKIPLRVYVEEMRTFKESFKLLVSIFFLDRIECDLAVPHCLYQARDARRYVARYSYLSRHCSGKRDRGVSVWATRRPLRESPFHRAGHGPDDRRRHRGHICSLLQLAVPCCHSRRYWILIHHCADLPLPVPACAEQQDGSLHRPPGGLFLGCSADQCRGYQPAHRSIRIS